MNKTRAWIGALGAVTTTLGLIGVMHMPFARGLLMQVGGCPVGRATLSEMEPVRREVIRAERGTLQAPARPALGFDLDKTTRTDMDEWADRAHVSCHEQREGIVFCKDVPAASLGLPATDGPVAEVHFAFGKNGALVDLATMRNHATVKPVQDIQARLEAQVGAPQQTSGAFDEAHLAQLGPRSLSTATYRYRDYVAEVMAMRFPSDGLVVREHYMSAND